MAYRDDEFEDEEDDETASGDRDDPDPSDTDDNDDPELIPCPYCRKEIPEIAEVCRHCGSFLSFEGAPRRQPRWIVAGVVILLAAILLGWLLSAL
jgi:predicted nucleic acid-binding Zn ribbon protein